MFNNSHPGVEYGDGVLKGPGVPGLGVKLVGGNQFSVVDDAADDAAGVLQRCDTDCSAQGATDTTPCVVAMGTTVFQTDQVTGTAPAAGDLLAFDATTAKLKKATTGLIVVGRCLAVDGTTYTVLLTLNGEVVGD